MTSIGRRCRGGNVYSRAILITQTLSGEQSLKKTKNKKQDRSEAISKKPSAERIGKDSKRNSKKVASFLSIPVSFHLIQVQFERSEY